MTERQLQNEVLAVASGALLLPPVQGPPRCEAQLGQIGQTALRSTLSVG